MPMPMPIPILAAAVFACASPAAIDGDTLRCAGIGRVRLIGIDAPELAGHCRQGRACTPGDGPAARRALRSLIAGQRVICAQQARDRYGRVLALCNAAGRDLSCAMIARGHAVARYAPLQCGASRR